MTSLGNEVHVWRIELDGAARKSAALRNSLAAEERARMARLRTVELRERWATARGAMRCILAEYAECEPGELVFEVGARGKPSLLKPQCAISFNLSHSSGLAMLAVTGGARVGIDLEHVRAGVDVEDLSRRYFAKDERREILELAGEERVESFFRCWSRKEAFIKALGGGLSVPLDSFRVSVTDGGPAKLHWAQGEAAENWKLMDLSEPGLAAAMAVEDAGAVVRRMDFNAR